MPISLQCDIMVAIHFYESMVAIHCHVCGSEGHNARNKNCPGRMDPSNQQSGVTTSNTVRETRRTTQSSEATASNCPAVTTSKYVSPFHKECRPKTKPKKRVGLTGLGVYINPETGRTILNPGTSMSRVIDRGSQSSKPKPRNTTVGGAHGGQI